MDDIQRSVVADLSSTPYACSSIHPLSGGTANFVYRGVLSAPLADGTRTVVIKHTEDFIASNRDFKLSAERCKIEECILAALNDFPVTAAETPQHNITVRTPHFYFFNPATNTQVVEELPSSQDLKSFFTAPDAASRAVSREWAVGVGRALGTWLRAFHAWGDAAAQSVVKSAMAENRLMRDLKCTINYDNLVAAVDRYPGLLEGSRGVFERVREMARGELGRAGEGSGLIHGDFWSGNVLVNTAGPRSTRLFVVDWEMAQCGPRALDLGQMIAELYELTHFKGEPAGRWIVEGLVEGYADLGEEMAFRTAIHVGTHLICWGSTVAGWGTDEQVQEVVRIGRDLVVNGWEKNRGGFEGVWGCLFR
ncbi:kinase-like domain-containing protein [Aspergillus ambiguus]|uniref:uncharacterized protein n=1 Tax=Aspergillus ambiguus TaxID=176160 RepID=UPI003CCE2D00